VRAFLFLLETIDGQWRIMGKPYGTPEAASAAGMAWCKQAGTGRVFCVSHARSGE